MQGIRGARASASLKRVRVHVSDLDHEKHPRRARLGLIEAMARARFHSPPCRASEARAPLPNDSAASEIYSLAVLDALPIARASASLKRVRVHVSDLDHEKHP